MNKKLIRLTESDLHRIVKESVNKILTEGVGRRKSIHETPNVIVKQAGKYHGRDPKGIFYNVYVDGAKMFCAKLCGSEYDEGLGGRFQQKGTYNTIYIDYPSRGNTDSFRKQIGFNSYSDLNGKQAKTNLQQLVQYATLHMNDKFIVIDKLGGFTPQNAPYIIQRCIEGLITPINRNKTKQTDVVTFYDLNGEERTMSVKDAYKYAMDLYREISEWGYDDEVDKPNGYFDVNDCIEEYIKTLQKIEITEREPGPDWFEMNDKGYFDNIY